MKFFPFLTLILVGAVLGILAESEELSSDILNCLEELHPLFKQYVAHQEKCRQRFLSQANDINEDADDGEDENDESNQAEHWASECTRSSLTDEQETKMNEIGQRCEVIIVSLPPSQKEKVKALMEQDEWSRVVRNV